ncbi:related to 54S ribosomal protein L4, mitochondrial [Ramularia collo-cygni]|uniref:Large ribosomal subunit protein uL29m n=1 Tax=Ramularia collo-cygni TaxID=112498 RepID=A0A2D3UT15_9PEZI|nr:related to 54S ribosomal protein L4, mitochondrial [Ramularia collo-cygni]CZT19491.1 related to 54S ribosomal protein L4, mitochondrial [Ramularia collo-cygni]
MPPPAMHCTCKTVLSGVFGAPISRAATFPPSFLIPAISAPFSTTSSQQKPPRKDGNPRRGVSALYRSGLNKTMWKANSVKNVPLPKPVLDPARRTQIETDPDHGLWEFFPANKTLMATPAEMHAHGRAWTVQELRAKDWDDLHRLWWVCIKERNRLFTYEVERKRLGPMYGDYESGERMKVIKHTMKAIKHTLTERWYTWDSARSEAMLDEEINMYADVDNGEIAYLRKEDDLVVDEQLSAPEGSEQAMPPADVPKMSTEARA